jgi:hypothetical protein
MILNPTKRLGSGQDLVSLWKILIRSGFSKMMLNMNLKVHSTDDGVDKWVTWYLVFKKLENNTIGCPLREIKTTIYCTSNSCGIQRNVFNFHDMEFRIIPRNWGQFSYCIQKKIGTECYIKYCTCKPAS